MKTSLEVWLKKLLELIKKKKTTHTQNCLSRLRTKITCLCEACLAKKTQKKNRLAQRSDRKERNLALLCYGMRLRYIIWNIQSLLFITLFTYVCVCFHISHYIMQLRLLSLSFIMKTNMPFILCFPVIYCLVANILTKLIPRCGCWCFQAAGGNEGNSLGRVPLSFPQRDAIRTGLLSTSACSPSLSLSLPPPLFSLPPSLVPPLFPFAVNCCAAPAARAWPVQERWGTFKLLRRVVGKRKLNHLSFPS